MIQQLERYGANWVWCPKRHGFRAAEEQVPRALKSPHCRKHRGDWTVIQDTILCLVGSLASAQHMKKYLGMCPRNKIVLCHETFCFLGLMSFHAICTVNLEWFPQHKLCANFSGRWKPISLLLGGRSFLAMSILRSWKQRKALCDQRL